MKQVIINENDAGQRLDKFLTKYMPKLPQSLLYKGLRKNCVRVNGRHIKKAEYKLNCNDVLSLYFNDEFFEKKAGFVPTKHKLDVVYEDENVLLINKRPGVVVHADDRNTKNTLIDEIKSYLYEKGEYRPDSEHSFAPSLCNRLDRNTGGIIIAAKKAAALRILNEKIKSREIKKLYLCIVDGHPKKEGSLEAYLTRHEKKVSVSDTFSENSKLIKTNYRVVAENEDTSLLEVELLTGRTHQIRAQLAAIGHPLTGDVKYGGSPKGKYQSLYSYRLIFDFKTDAGILNYMTGMDFSVSVDFAQSFSHTNL